jgi:hypothetical protein
MLASCGGRVADGGDQGSILNAEGSSKSADEPGNRGDRRGDRDHDDTGDDERPGKDPSETPRGDRDPPPREQPPYQPTPHSSRPAGDAWKNECFTTWDPPSCTGARYVRYDDTYDKYVGVILCGAAHYKIYLSESRTEPFYQIGDYAGHGQDHCELINPDFRIPNEDDMQSGGCTACSNSADSASYENPVGTRGYSRAVFGDPFRFEPVWPQYNLYTVDWYACDVSFPVRGATCPNEPCARPAP